MNIYILYIYRTFHDTTFLIQSNSYYAYLETSYPTLIMKLSKVFQQLGMLKGILRNLPNNQKYKRDNPQHILIVFVLRN